MPSQMYHAMQCLCSNMHDASANKTTEKWVNMHHLQLY